MAKEKQQERKKNMQTGAISYPVGDFLIRLKNAAMANTSVVTTNDSNFVAAVAQALKKEGFIESIERKEGKLKVRLAYHRKNPVIINVELVSKPGLRIYGNSDEITKTKGSFKYILSTSKGIMSSHDAIKARLGGEIIAKVY